MPIKETTSQRIEKVLHDMALDKSERWWTDKNVTIQFSWTKEDMAIMFIKGIDYALEMLNLLGEKQEERSKE